MPLGSAHRLVPEATFIDPDPEADRGAAEAVFEALGRSSPSLAGSVDPRSVSFGLFEVGIDGLGPLWGAEPVLAERLVDAVTTALPGEVRPRAGIAGTHFVATIAAMVAEPAAPLIVPAGDEAAFLADRPSGLLTTDLDVRARLTRFGLRLLHARERRRLDDADADQQSDGHEQDAEEKRNAPAPRKKLIFGQARELADADAGIRMLQEKR